MPREGLTSKVYQLASRAEFRIDTGWLMGPVKPWFDQSPLIKSMSGIVTIAVVGTSGALGPVLCSFRNLSAQFEFQEFQGSHSCDP